MKKTITTLAIVLGICLSGMAQQQGGGVFQRGPVIEETSNDYNTRNGSSLMLPGSHGETDDQNGPVGSGLLLLAGMSGEYLILKKKEDKE